MSRITQPITEAFLARFFISIVCVMGFPFAVLWGLPKIGVASGYVIVPCMFIGIVCGFYVMRQILGKYQPKCPRCKNPDTRFEVDERNNQVFICDSCGLEEAIANLDD